MRYQIWNKTDAIITPSGTQFTAQEWADRYPWIKLPGAKMIITAGLINGGAAMEYNATVEHYKKSGAAITDLMTEDEVMAAIEEFEDNPPGVNEPGPEERIAAALEAQVMLAEPEAAAVLSSRKARAAVSESPAFDRIRRNYMRGLWSASMLQVAVEKGHITAAEAERIMEEKS